MRLRVEISKTVCRQGSEIIEMVGEATIFYKKFRVMNLINLEKDYDLTLETNELKKKILKDNRKIALGILGDNGCY